MKIIFFLIISSFSVLGIDTNSMAPNFSLPSASGKTINLSDYRGRIIVLEWLNHGCPFVRKHYDSGNMQNLQDRYTKKNVVWLSVISSAPGKQGHVSADKALKEKNQFSSRASEILLDSKGDVGRSYEAKTTPHMYIISAEGKLVYQGAIDDRPDTDPSSVKSSKNYISGALDELIAGKPVTISSTKAYGCSVKY